MTYDDVVALAASLPEYEEGTSYGTRALKVRGKLFAREHQDGESLVLKVDFDTRDFLLKRNSKLFYITDHYKGYPYILVRLREARKAALRELLEQAWRMAAPKRLASLLKSDD